MNPFALVLLIACIVTFALGCFAPFVVTEIRRTGKARIIWWDPDAGRFDIMFYKRMNGNEVHIGKGESMKRFILEARARQPGRWPTWVIHPRYGWNFLALSDVETVDRDPLLQRLAISNPASYHNQISINKPRQGFRANDPDDKSWIVTAVIVAGILLALVFVGVMFLVFTLGGSGAAPPPVAAPVPGGV